MSRRLWPVGLCLAGGLWAGSAAFAQTLPDSSFQSYVAGLGDSTEHYFGGDSLTFDSAGVDSLAALYTRHPELGPPGQREYDPRRRESENGPILRNSRVEGVVTGARVQLRGLETGPGSLSGMAAWSFGLHESRYALGWSRGFGRRQSSLVAHVSAYRSTQFRDVAEVEPDPGLRLARLSGGPGELRFRREGDRVRLVYWNSHLAVEAGFRDEQAHSLSYPGSFGGFLVNGVPADRLADPRTVRAASAAFGLGTQPADGLFKLNLEHGGLGGAFHYNCVRLAAGRTFRLASLGLVGVQAAWGAADSGAPAQERFYAGGARALSGYPDGALEGRQLYLGRATALFGPDILGAAGIPHPAIINLSLALFAETGAAPELRPEDGLAPRKPAGGDWASDVGMGLWYQPGLPDAESYIKLNVAVPVGPHNDHRGRVSASWTRLLDWF